MFGSNTIAKFAAMAIMDNGNDQEIKKLEEIINKSWSETDRFSFNRYCEALNVKPLDIE